MKSIPHPLVILYGWSLTEFEASSQRDGREGTKPEVTTSWAAGGNGTRRRARFPFTLVEILHFVFASNFNTENKR